MHKSSSTLSKLPTIFTRWLGYRPANWAPTSLPTWRVCLWSFLGAWIGIALLEIIGLYSPQLQQYHSPVVIASFGASAVLIYGTIDAPLAQPRNFFFGHIIGALVGVIFSVLFTELPTAWSSPEQETAVRWVTGATAMATSLVLMQLTVTVHPPGGATALIAVVDNTVRGMRWYYIGIVAMSAAVQLVVACLVNNVEKKYPSYWWAPAKLPVHMQSSTLATMVPLPSHHGELHADEVVVDVENSDKGTSSSSTATIDEYDAPPKKPVIVLDGSRYFAMPEDLSLTQEETDMLYAINAKLAGMRQ